MAMCVYQFMCKKIQHQMLFQQVSEISNLTMDFPHWELNPKHLDKASNVSKAVVF